MTRVKKRIKMEYSKRKADNPQRKQTHYEEIIIKIKSFATESRFTAVIF